MEILEQTQNAILMVVLVILALFLFAGLVRAVKGPRIADRLVAGNMIGTMVIVIIAVLSLLLGEDYLLDVCLIYAMVSFLAVVVLAKVYMGIYEEGVQKSDHMEELAQKAEKKEKQEGEADGGNHGMD